MKIRKPGGPDKVQQEMTPMIDIVFQLLAFFVMSFKVASTEGNFDIKMPLAAPGDTTPLFPPIKIYMKPAANGQAEVVMNSDSLGTGKEAFDRLRGRVRNMVAPAGNDPGGAADLEVELDCEYNLHYDNVIRAITAVSGYMTLVNGEAKLVKLIEKIKFAQPRKNTSGG